MGLLFQSDLLFEMKGVYACRLHEKVKNFFLYLFRSQYMTV